MIAIRFRHPPQQLFRETPLEDLEPNWIVLRLQPAEEHAHGDPRRTAWPGHAHPRGAPERQLSQRRGAAADAYEALLLDVIAGDTTQVHPLRRGRVGLACGGPDPQVLGSGAGLHPHLSCRELGTRGSEPAVRRRGYGVAQRRVAR